MARAALNMSIIVTYLWNVAFLFDQSPRVVGENKLPEVAYFLILIVVTVMHE